MSLDDIGDKYPFELSGGMRQRAPSPAPAIGSPLLLMDRTVWRARPGQPRPPARRAAGCVGTAEPKTTVLFVTHDVDEALYLGQAGGHPRLQPHGQVIRRPEHVPFPRHRDRRALFASAEFQLLRTDCRNPGGRHPAPACAGIADAFIAARRVAAVHLP
ncbi:MAG: hypothetical protein U1E47_00175 [Rivihabitans pingtungensis]